MKNLRWLMRITIFMTFLFMFIALFQYKAKEDTALLPDRFEVNLNEGWTMVSLDSSRIDEAGQKDYGKIQELVQDALETADWQKITLPYNKTGNAGDIMVFQNTLSKDFAGLTLSFESADAAVSVVLDGEIIYQYGFGKLSTLEKMTGNTHNYAAIPNVFEDGELLIELIPPYSDAAAALESVRVETRDVVVIGIVGSSIVDIGCCFLMLLMSFIMFVLALIRHYTHQPSRGELFLGLTGVAAGAYCFIGTDTLSIFYNIQKVYAMQEYLVLLVPLFLALYFERNLHKMYPRRSFALLLCVVVGALLQIMLQLLGVRDMESMVDISAVLGSVVIVTAIVSLIQFDYGQKRVRTLLSVLSLSVLLAGGIANKIVNIILKDTYGNKIGQYCMAVFSLMMAGIHILQLSKEYRKNAEDTARLLEEKIKMVKQQNAQLAAAKMDADAARQEALAANDAKGKFLAHMSHEIRTPINAVLGMDEMILRETKEQHIKEYAMDIHTAGQTLLSLINDILDFSKIDSGKMEIVPVEYDISSMIHDLEIMTSQRASVKNIKVEVQVDARIPSRLYGDDVRIRQVLMNILTNAVKYTHEGTVWLRVQSRTTGDTVILAFEVEDTGIGIKEEDLPNLSAEFKRIEEDRNRNIEGTGLGMSITIQLLALLGSKLQVESVYGKGSKFSFELEQKIIDNTPIGDFESRVYQAAENYDYRTKFCAPDAKILVVDDNAVNRKVLRNLLKETLIQVMEAGGGRECLELVQKNHYDLIFLDHMMPEMDGVETLHHIKQLDACPCKDTPIVVLTANAVSGAKEKYLAEGFDDFLSKPVVPEKLENMIRKKLPDELLQEAPAEMQESDSQIEGEPDVPDAFLEELPQVDGLDWQYAWMHLPDQELLEYTVKEFYAQIDDAADRLEQAYGRIADQEQLDQYRIQVHAMKSLTATVGIMPLSGVAKLLEYAAKDGKIEVVESITPAFLEEWRSYRQKLQGVFGIEAAAGKEVTDTSVILALVDMIRFSMQEMDIDQADQLIGQLRAYVYPEEIGQNVRKLAEAVTNLDPEGADRFAALLINQLENRS